MVKMEKRENPDIVKADFNQFTETGGKRCFIRTQIGQICHHETPGASYQDNGFWFQTFCFAKKSIQNSRSGISAITSLKDITAI